MKKYIVWFIVILAGIVLLLTVGLDKPTESTKETIQANIKEEPLLQTEAEKNIEAEKKEKAVKVLTADSIQVQMVEKEIEIRNVAKPKRKLLGGADVDFIEKPEENKGQGNFGSPPM